MDILKRNLPRSCHPNRRMKSVDGLVIHYISDRYRHPEDPFNIDYIYSVLEDYGYSYHVIVQRSGDVIETLPQSLEAWHAGRSRMNGRNYCNRFTHGAALVGGVGFGYTQEQISKLAQWTAQDMSTHGYTTDNIKGHDNVRSEWNDAFPDRKAADKQDPGEEFPWDEYLEMIEGVDIANRVKLAGS